MWMLFVLLYCHFNDVSRVSGEKHVYLALHLEQEVPLKEKKRVFQAELEKYEPLHSNMVFEMRLPSCKPSNIS